MTAAGADKSGVMQVVAAAALVAGLALAARASGFGDGVILAVTASSGAAFAAVLKLRWRGVVAVAAGFAAADGISGLPVGAVTVDSLGHGLAALVAWRVMRFFARRRGDVRTRNGEWLILLAGVSVFSAMVCAVLAAGGLMGLIGPPDDPVGTPWLALVFEPLGVLTFFSVLASMREWKAVVARPVAAAAIGALALFLLVVLALLLWHPAKGVHPSGITLLLSVPFCLFISMRSRSLDGAAISFVAVSVALALVLARTGGIVEPDFVMTVVYLNMLVAGCQFVHAVNIDRLEALAEIDARKRDLEERVAARTADLTEMTERAIASDEAKTRFLATVSHEVRTPLNGVIGMTSVLLAGDLDEDVRRNVGVIRTSGFHLLAVINRILDFSKLDENDTPDDIIEFDLHGVIVEVVEEARFSIRSDAVSIRVFLEPDVVVRRVGWRQGLRQILTNLVGNAVKFTDSGVVAVRASEMSAGAIRIEVRDSGIGIPAEAQDRIFLPFEQGDGTMTRRYGGTGLGLAICSEMTRRMGGKIGVESAPDEGALFWVELPLPVPGSAECDAEEEQLAALS